MGKCLAIPPSRVARSGSESASLVAGCQIESPGWHAHLEAAVVERQLTGAVEHSSMAGISAANAPRHFSSSKLFEAVCRALRMQRRPHKSVKEMIRALLDEDAKQTPVDFPGDGS